jgi:hypothetical protein
MGRALNGTLQDVLVRWHRMRGYDTLWQPGYDHAGISTQNVVEKQLLAEGTSRQEIGREAFLERTWAWLEETGRTIMGQFRQLGCSLDYSRERFTMDDGYVEAVMRFFVHCWERGWMYRANRIVNWCPFHETAISDLEVVHEPMDDNLIFARYPLTDGSGSITVATVRPATMLADVAVAVHPEDERYRHAVGKEVVVPFVERAVPVVADDLVEPEFGTGALKVTPGHDPVDFEIGRRHDLPVLTVIGLDGRMNEDAGELAGLTQKEADQAVVAWLGERDLLEKAATLGSVFWLGALVVLSRLDAPDSVDTFEFEDIDALTATDVPLIFQRSELAWATHPQNYRQLEGIVTTVGKNLFGRELDYAWCHIAAPAKQLRKIMPKVKNPDLSVVAEMIFYLQDNVHTRDVDWLAWEDPFILARDAAALKHERENSLEETNKRLRYILPMIETLTRLSNNGRN